MFEDFLFRAHYAGELVTESKEKSNIQIYNETLDKIEEKTNKLLALSDKAVKSKIKLENEIDSLNFLLSNIEPVKNDVKLSETCVTRLSKIFTEFDTLLTRDIRNKYIEKGLKMEEDAITLYSLFCGKMYTKNTERKSNGYFSGEIDFKDDNEDMTIDTKVAYDVFSFDNTLQKGISKIYYAQGQVYMWLWGKSRHRICYALLNTPKGIVEAEKRKLLFDFTGTEKDLNEAYNEIERLHNYDNLPLERKLKFFDIERNEEFIKLLIEMTPHWRAKLEEIRKNAYSVYENRK